MSNKIMNICWQIELKTEQKFILIALADYADDSGICFPSYEKLSKKCSTSKRIAIRTIKNLIELGVIEKVNTAKKATNSYRIKVEELNNLTKKKLKTPKKIADKKPVEGVILDHRGGDPRSPGGVILDHPYIEPSLLTTNEPSFKNINYIPSLGETMKQTKTPKLYVVTDGTVTHYEDPVSEIFEHWKSVMNHPRSKLDSPRTRLIEARLKDYSVEDLKLAIDGCANSPHHMGQNDNGMIYDSIELIFRNNGKVDQFIGFNTRVRQKSKAEIRQADMLEDLKNLELK